MTTPDEIRAVRVDIGALRGLRRVFAGNHAELAHQLARPIHEKSGDRADPIDLVA